MEQAGWKKVPTEKKKNVIPCVQKVVDEVVSRVRNSRREAIRKEIHDYTGQRECGSECYEDCMNEDVLPYWAEGGDFDRVKYSRCISGVEILPITRLLPVTCN